jgi:LPS O-antigen subunit length determinant protein (WzzB/FepE family)
MSESMGHLLNEVRDISDELDSDSPRNVVVRFLAKAYLERRKQQNEQLENTRKRVDQLTGRNQHDSQGMKEADVSLGNSLQGTDNPYIGSSK